ncbi:MAG: hypothetical protein P8Y45_02135 [Exilibacterium sp.]
MSLARNATANQSPNYERHQPEQTLLYPLVEQQYPAFKVKGEQKLTHSVHLNLKRFGYIGVNS